MNTFANSLRNSLRDNLRDSVFSVLGIEQVPHCPAAVDTIRQAMLRELGSVDSQACLALRARIRRTKDATGLWFARSELYAHLCRTHCEPVAQERVQALQPLFVGQVPASLMGRSSGPARDGSRRRLQGLAEEA